MERAAPNAAADFGVLQDARDAVQHFAGRASRERQQQDTFGRDALGDLVGDAMHERCRLACSRAGDDQQRIEAVADGLLLWVV